ncbi:cytochrome P450 [Colletotrichum phormii]|uniref:Cytochrome P450 n=1 Tax=Colletotrichum phormii TaxID=359342 RepID=A0AAJ0EKA8_9PEZI|nr:cytochrome P450 [Colletotrichum phormii]KAK1654392.1 cytochrome P450 [Colletotrichum phormii]
MFYCWWDRHPIWTTLATVLAIFVLFRVFGTVRRYHRLRHFKGPPLAAVSKLWLLKTVTGSRGDLDFYKVTKRYGSLARIGPNDLLNDDPALMRHMLGVRSAYRRSDWYDGMRFNPSRDNVLSCRDEDEHTKLRSKMAAGYSGREVQAFEKKIDGNLFRLIKLIDSYVDAGRPFDFGRKAQFFTLDVISDLAFGEPFGFVGSDSDMYEYIKTTEDNLPVFMAMTVLPWVIRLFRYPFLRSMLPTEKDPLGFGKVMGIAKKFSAERFGSGGKVQRDMLGSFVAHGLTHEEAESEILLQIIAGSDTTATAIRATLLYIITNPRVHNKLVAEILSATTADAYTTETATRNRLIITDAEARNLPYLQAVIKEGLRVFPPVAGLMAKQVPPEGDTWNGAFIPGGTRIGWSAWAMFRRQDVFGDDADEFRPERWLAGEGKRLREMEATIELVFSYGRYQCLGRPVALMELNKVFFELLLRFELTICDPLNPWKTFNCGIHAQSEYWIRARRRV